MPWTTIDELTPKRVKVPQDRAGLENGDGSEDKYGALYYFKDIEKVIQQDDFEKLIRINVIFELKDGHNHDPSGNPVHEVTVIAAENNAGHILNKVALPWAPYYDPESDSGTMNFPGHDSYFPGRLLRKRK